MGDRQTSALAGSHAAPAANDADGSSPLEVLATGPAPAAAEFGFDALVRPLSTREFLDTRYRDKRPVLFRSEGPRFASLCTWDQLNELLSGAWQSRLSLVRDGTTISPGYYTVPPFGHGWRGRRRELLLDDRRLMTCLRKGATVVLRGIQDFHPPVRPVADAIEETLGGYSGINLYASWVATRGFSTHWDDHDVFVLQVAGEKRWDLYGETRRFPLSRDAEATTEPPRQTVWSGLLRAGDALYIPRGWWHDARTEPGDGAGGRASMHFTCALHPLTGLDLMEWLSGRLARHETFRRDLPHPAHATGHAHYAELRELILHELQGDLGRRFRDHLRSTWSERPQASLGTYLDPWKAPDWERYGIRIRGAHKATLEADGDGNAILEANGYRWTFDGRCRELLAPLLRGGMVRVGSFREAVADGSPTAFADEFLKLLLMQGIACAVPPGHTSGQGS